MKAFRNLLCVCVLAGATTFAADLADPASFTEQAPEQFKVTFETSRGDFDIEVYRAWAPKGADRFYNLVTSGYFDEARFFRVVPNFVVQWGMHADPAITGAWRKARIEDDPVKSSNTRGTITFATSGPNSRTTQLFINLKDNKRLDGMGFSPFGKVTAGFDVVQEIYPGYGERPNQGLIGQQGNAYLTEQFPKLDYIKATKITVSGSDDAEVKVEVAEPDGE